MGHLSWTCRHKNVQQALAVSQKGSALAADHDIFPVNSVITTGAMLDSYAETLLRQTGRRLVVLLVFARVFKISSCYYGWLSPYHSNDHAFAK